MVYVCIYAYIDDYMYDVCESMYSCIHIRLNICMMFGVFIYEYTHDYMYVYGERMYA